MADSLIATSASAHVLCYVDNDQVDLYRNHCDWESLYGGRLKLTFGPSIGPARSINVLVHGFKDYDIYGLITDDSEFATPGWDEYLVGVFQSLPGRIGVVSPSHDQGPYVNWPYVSREWIDVVGFFAENTVYHFMWDTVIELLGETTRIVWANRDEFHIKHHQLPPCTSASPRDFQSDASAFWGWILIHRASIVKRLREKIRAATPA